MCEQQYQAEVLDELKMQDLADKVEVCIYCGTERKGLITPCCGELHFEFIGDNNE